METARSIYRVRYEKEHLFDAPPERIWDLVEHPETFPQMWPWMKRPRLDRERVEPGARLSFIIDPPFPFRMKVEAAFTEVVPNERVAAAIDGDLEGTAWLDVRAAGKATVARVAWDVEMKERKMRVAARVARPVLVRAHDWAVSVALRGFRRRLARSS